MLTKTIKKINTNKILLIILLCFYLFMIFLFKNYSFNQKYLSPIIEICWMKSVSLTNNTWVKINYTYYPNRYYLTNKKYWNWILWKTNLYWIIILENKWTKLEREKVLYHELTHYNVDKMYAINKNGFRNKFNHLANLFVKWDTFIKNNKNTTKYNSSDIRFINYIRRTIVLLQMWLYKKEFSEGNKFYSRFLDYLSPIPFTKKKAMTNELMAYQASYPLDKQLINNKPVFLNDMSWKEIYCNKLNNNYLKDFCYTIDWLNSQIWKKYKKSK